MQSFTDKNKETNGAKFSNIDFLCADVTKLELSEGRYINSIFFFIVWVGQVKI